MKKRIIALRQRYVEGLRSYLRKASRAQVQKALNLGRQAVAHGLETPELAQIHQWALDKLKISKGKRDMITKAERFFTEATSPIVVLHSEACRKTRELNNLKQTLRERTSALKRAQRTLRCNVEKSQTTEANLKAHGKHNSTLLKESHLMRDSLQHLTRKVLNAQEQQRNQISHELQDDIAQTLLGINVRLLLLRTKAGQDGLRLSGDIAKTQELVDKSRRSMRTVTRRIGTS
jgi:signal transduction histidine kinase